MKKVAGIPVFEIEFDRDAKLVDKAQAKALQDHLAADQATDLILFAHGWNNDMKDARELYTRYFEEVGALLAAGTLPALTSRRFAGAVALWPSKKFTDADLIPGGAAALSSKEAAAVRARIKALGVEPTRLGKSVKVGAAKQKKIARALALVKKLDESVEVQAEFVTIIRSLLSDRAAHEDDGTKGFFKADARLVLQKLGTPVPIRRAAGQGGAAGGVGSTGGAAGLGDVANGIVAGARRLLNFTTYYQMKERAGVVGATGVAPLLRKLRQAQPKLRLHLVGHSFGGRVVTAAADAAESAADKIDTLTLLQAAYSHNGLASKFDDKNDGFFRKVISGKKVRGPIVVTCTKNDTAVGIAYPLASRVAGQNAAALGDANDPYGGIGRNGAVNMRPGEAEAGVLAAVPTAYAFTAGTVYNLNADRVIGDHSDICKPEVAWAMLSAIAAG